MLGALILIWALIYPPVVLVILIIKRRWLSIIAVLALFGGIAWLWHGANAEIDAGSCTAAWIGPMLGHVATAIGCLILHLAALRNKGKKQEPDPEVRSQ